LLAKALADLMPLLVLQRSSNMVTQKCECCMHRSVQRWAQQLARQVQAELVMLRMMPT
jgi:hypothetical protein